MSEQSTRVVHVNDNIPGAVYIGRPMNTHGLAASPFGNPFRLPHRATPEERALVIDRYRAHLLEHPALLARIPDLRGKPLACLCRHDGEAKTDDNACHGDVLIELLERYTDDELLAEVVSANGGERSTAKDWPTAIDRDHELLQSVFLAIARNPPSKQPAAVLAAIRETHVVIERGRWERVRACAEAADYYGKTKDGRDAVAALQSGDLDEG